MRVAMLDAGPQDSVCNTTKYVAWWYLCALYIYRCKYGNLPQHALRPLLSVVYGVHNDLYTILSNLCIQQNIKTVGTMSVFPHYCLPYHYPAFACKWLLVWSGKRNSKPRAYGMPVCHPGSPFHNSQLGPLKAILIVHQSEVSQTSFPRDQHFGTHTAHVSFVDQQWTMGGHKRDSSVISIHIASSGTEGDL